jgi:hypothetical protein
MRLLYFSPVPWDSYEQRPHYFARHFLALGGAVVWIDPYPARLPRWADLTRMRRREPALELPRPRDLTVLPGRGWPIDPLPGGPRLNAQLFWRRRLAQLSAYTGRETVLGIGRPTAMARAALEHVPRAWSFYDAMDDFPEFYTGASRRATARTESAIARTVDRVVASSRHLYDKFAPVAHDLRLVRNAYDMDLLPPFTGDRPARAELGFIGAVAQWFDWTLLARVADAIRPMPITLMGPRIVAPPATMPANIHYRPPCHQREGAAWLQTISAGLIPFVRSPLTAGIDPIKYYQYRGAGLPVLTSTFGEMAARGPDDGTFALDGADGPRAAIDHALAWRPTAAAVERFRAEHTWTHRFESVRIYEAP